MTRSHNDAKRREGTHRIVWSSKATGADETFYVGTLTKARTSARQMIGNPVTFKGEQIGVIESAYVADDQGNEK